MYQKGYSDHTEKKKYVLAFQNDAQIYVPFTIRPIQKNPVKFKRKSTKEADVSVLETFGSFCFDTCFFSAST